MARSGVAVDEVIQAPGLSTGEVHERLLTAMALDGDYQAVQVGPDRFQFARTFRPTWAIVTAWITALLGCAGLLLLLIKSTEVCLAVIEADHRGSRLRIQGRIGSAALGRIRVSLSSGNAASVGDVPPSAPQAAPQAGSHQAPSGPTPIVGAPVASTFPEIEQASAASPFNPPTPPTPTLSAPGTGSGSPTPGAIPVRPPALPTSGPTPPASPAAAGFNMPPPSGPPVGRPAPPPHAGQADWIAGASISGSGESQTVTPSLSLDQFDGGSDWGSKESTSFSGAENQQPADGGPHAVLDDGTAIPLSDLTLIGRDPLAHEDEMATTFSITDRTMSVSKTHFAIRRESGNWFVVDRNSTNGVVLVDPSGAETPVEPGVPTPLHEGVIVRFGGRNLRLVSAGIEPAGGSLP